MSSKIFNVGDVVELKSGGPKMTVKDVTQKFVDAKPVDGYDCKCTWFVDTELKTEWFDEQELRKHVGYPSDPSSRVS